MEMNRRTFMKYFFIFTSAYGVVEVLHGHEERVVKSDVADVRIKKYIGRIKPMGAEIGTEGKWLG